MRKRALAYADVPVEVAQGRYLLDPRSLAKLLQLAKVTADDKVLDVGCATGYSSAVLGRLAKSVIALEQDADLVRIASEALAQAEGDVEVTQGALIEGFKMGGPYDVILVNGAIEARPWTRLLAQLAEKAGAWWRSSRPRRLPGEGGGHALVASRNNGAVGQPAGL